MRANASLELKVGLLIVAGLCATLGMVLISDRLHFENYYRIQAFLPDAGGLRLHSPVTLEGIRIGEVENLVTTSDPRGNVVVRLKIQDEFRLPVNTKLTLASSGIFGDSYMAFTGALGTKNPLLPLDGTGFVIAKPGFFDTASQQAQKVLEGASDLLGPDARKDFRRLLKNAADLAEVSTALAKRLNEQGSQIEDAISQTRELTLSLRDGVKDMRVKVDAILAQVQSTLTSVHADAQDLTSKTGTSLQQFDAVLAHGDAMLSANSGKISAGLDSLNDLMRRCSLITKAITNGDGVLGQLVMNHDLAKDLNNTAIDVSRTVSYLAEHPNALVFGMGTQDAAAMRVRREREKERRAFNENYGGIPLMTQPTSAPTPASASSH